MKIQFEIKETLAGILDQLLHSDFWITEVEEIDDKRKLIKIRDFAYPQEATAEVSENEILLKTAWSKYTYRLYEVNHVCWCEYTGAYRGLLEQKLLRGPDRFHIRFQLQHISSFKFQTSETGHDSRHRSIKT